MNVVIQYFNQQSPDIIIAEKKEDSENPVVFYSGSYHDLEVLRELVNRSIDQLQSRDVRQPISLIS